MIRFALLQILFVCCVLLFATACDKEGNFNCPDITIGDFAYDDIGDVYFINKADMFANCLYLEVSYGGGCLADELQLRWNGSLAESLPPQAFLTLWHDDFNDPCDAIEDTALLFDLSVLQAGSSYETILINVFGLDSTLYYQMPE